MDEYSEELSRVSLASVVFREGHWPWPNFGLIFYLIRIFSLHGNMVN